MGIPAYSPEWASAFKDEINRSPVYRQSAAGWEGTVGLVVLAEPDKNFPEDRGVFLDLWHGEARDVEVTSREAAAAAKFVLTAAYTRWKEVATGKLDAVKGIMMGRLKLRGDLAMLVRYTRAAQELVRCTSRLPVEWPDEPATVPAAPATAPAAGAAAPETGEAAATGSDGSRLDGAATGT